MGFPGLGRLGSAEFQVELLRREIAVLKVAAVRGMKADRSELRQRAAEKLRQGAALTREEVASYMTVSTRSVQRMETKGKLIRCRGGVPGVRYAARDVLRLA